MRFVWILAILIAAAAMGAFFYWNRLPLVETVRPERGTAAEVVYATGVVEPVRWAKVTSLVGERIVEICNCEGRAVALGDVLARLNDSEARATLAELQARADFLGKESDRYGALLDRGAVTRQQYERTASELSRVQALIAAQRARLGNYELVSPLDGIVLRQDGEVGEIAGPGEILFWVGQPQPLEVVAEVNEEDIPRVAAGQTALVRADAYPDRTVKAEVGQITPKGDPITKTYRVRLPLPPDGPLFIGMSVEVNIVLRTAENALLVPREAVLDDTVFVVGADGRLSRRELQIGIRGTRKLEVISGLGEDEAIVSPLTEDLGTVSRVRRAGG